MDILWGGDANPELNKALGTWCAARIGMPRPFQEPYVTMGVFDGSNLMSVILYNNWQPEAGVIEFHGASVSSRWLTRPVLHAMFGYPFDEIGCQLVITRNSEHQTALLRQLTVVGFEHVTIPRLRGRHEAEHIFYLTDDAWKASRYLNPKAAMKRRPKKDQYVGEAIST